MALFRIRSAATYGIDAHLIDVEVEMYPGSDRDFITVGMPDTAVRESRERIKSALINSGFGYPSQSVTINLATANVRKEGAGFDLPMALGILGAMGRVASPDDHLFVGGAVAGWRGAAGARGAVDRRLRAQEGIANLVAPAENAAEASVAGGVRVFGVRHLAEVVRLLENPAAFTPHAGASTASAPQTGAALDFAMCAARLLLNARSKSPAQVGIIYFL